MTEGECGTDCMFIVADGELECVQTGDFVATYGAGQYFGELGLFQRPNESGVLPTRPVSVRGLSDESTVLQIWKHQLEAHPTIMKRLHAVTMGAPEVKATFELFRSMELFEGVDVESILQLAVQAEKIEVESECDDDDEHN